MIKNYNSNITQNDQQIMQIMDLLYTAQEMCPVLYAAVEHDDHVRFDRFCGDIVAGLSYLFRFSETMDNIAFQKLRPACQSCLDSLRRIQANERINQSICLKKIEFELLPLLQEAYLSFYYFQYLIMRPQHLADYNAKERQLLCSNSYIDRAQKTGQYKYDVSIFVLAYNKLDYTKQCIESLLANIPAGLNYELILVNHGSTDGTKEYFESLHPHKQLDIAVNGGGMPAVFRIVEGEFTIQISNDVIMTPYTIENLLECIRSDPQIAWVAPTTPNVSNLQTIPANYSSPEELNRFARQNNYSAPFRWEQRVRLCNPVDIRRNSVFYASNGICPNGAYHTFHPTYINSFPDDRVSLLLRRKGYKMILAKDAYCHHFGSVTLKNEIQQQNEQKFYLEGRREFYNAFGVDPWGTGFCYDAVFLNRVVGEEHGHVEVLGVNCGLGSNSLKIKEQIKEYCHNLDTCLSNITDDSSFILDLKGISDTAQTVTTIKELKAFLNGQAYQYIVWETPFLLKYKFKTVLEVCMGALAPGGKLIIKLTEQSREAIIRNFPDREELGNDWVICQRGEQI